MSNKLDDKNVKMHVTHSRTLSFDRFKRKMPSRVGYKDYYANTNDDCTIVNNDSNSEVQARQESLEDTSKTALAIQQSTSTTRKLCRVNTASPAHGRSRSDGSSAVEISGNKLLSLPSRFGIHSSLSSVSSVDHKSLEERNRYSDYRQCNLLGDNIIGSYQSPAPVLDTTNSIDNVTEKSENMDSLEPPVIGSRFPRPKPGESLISFLSSADLYKNCGMLDRENAHFYISEALMAAFEQVSH